ncbi:hypothetical protein CMI37_26120 [Candidatus Pacearchaeota archaeon]|nr:hypothetical protein [Candidatus Pacearchaeota archaeon]|tara:strand:+ start:10430 stop:11194 length:765 start_codon:yes stop_codon:yes gene_type:complete
MTANKLSKRWQLAHVNEQDFWKNETTESLLDYSKKHYQRKTDILLKRFSHHIKLNDKTKFLQVGCGPADVINCIKIGEKHSIDPLADFCKSKFKLNYEDTHLIQGVGENLPYKDNYFDIIIFSNVLDHTDNPKKVLSEINRVLKPNGILYFESHFHQKGFLLLADAYGFFKKTLTGKIFNPCHPHMFQFKDLKQLVSSKFEIVFEKIAEDIEKEIKNLKELREFRKNQKITIKIPAIFSLVGGINYTCICKKKT